MLDGRHAHHAPEEVALRAFGDHALREPDKCPMHIMLRNGCSNAVDICGRHLRFSLDPGLQFMYTSSKLGVCQAGLKIRNGSSVADGLMQGAGGKTAAGAAGFHGRPCLFGFVLLAPSPERFRPTPSL
jgi:hypothetical protein